MIMSYSKHMNKVLILFLTILAIINLFFIKIIAQENKVIFKLSNKSFTTVDLENRKRYLDFVGDNTELSYEDILNDFISVNIFNQFYAKSKKENDLDSKINSIYLDILNQKSKNVNFDKNKIDKENIFLNLELDLIRKGIIENILNNNQLNINNNEKNNDYIYSYKIEYINFDTKYINNHVVFKNVNFKNLDEVEKFLIDNKIEYIRKYEKVNDIEKINNNIKKNINSNKNFFKIEKNSFTSFFSITKQFQTYNSLFASLYSIKSDKRLIKEDLNCNLLKDKNFETKDYQFEKLNDKIKTNLININDYIEINNENSYTYIILCDLKFNKELINNFLLNKKINKLARNIEKNFIEKHSKIFNLVLTNE